MLSTLMTGLVFGGQRFVSVRNVRRLHDSSVHQVEVVMEGHPLAV